MRPGYRSPYRRRRSWWRRWPPAWWRRLAAVWHAHVVEVASRVDDVVLVLALLCGLLGVVWTLYVLAP